MKHEIEIVIEHLEVLGFEPCTHSSDEIQRIHCIRGYENKINY